MKIKIILSSLLLCATLLAFAQEKTNFEKQITHYSLKIDSIVSAEKIKMNLELSEIEKNTKEGKISEIKMQEEKARISTRYEQIINEKIMAERDELDEITKTSARNAVLGKNDEYPHAKDHKKERHPKELLNSFYFPFSTAFLNITPKNKLLNFNKTDVSNSNTGSYTFGASWERQIGKNTSAAFINFGLGLRSDFYYLNDDQIFTQENNQLQTSPFFAGNLKYSRLNVHYLEIPVNFNWVLNPKYIDFKGEKFLDASKRQFRVGIGLYSGVKIGNKIRYRYRNAESSKNIVIQRVENGINSFEFGGKLSIGYAGFNLFIKRDFTPIFNNKASLTHKYAMSMGLELASVNF